jgi:hypothetical protein
MAMSRRWRSLPGASADSARTQDIETWFALLDLDDHVTFGGKA